MKNLKQQLQESLMDADFDVTDGDIASIIIHDIMLKNNPKILYAGRVFSFCGLNTSNAPLIRSLGENGLSMMMATQMEKELDAGNAVLIIYPISSKIQAIEILTMDSRGLRAWPLQHTTEVQLRSFQEYQKLLSITGSDMRRAGRVAKVINLGSMTYDEIEMQFKDLI